MYNFVWIDKSKSLKHIDCLTEVCSILANCKTAIKNFDGFVQD